MTRLLRAELLKLATTRTFAAFAAITVVTSLLIAVLVATLTRPDADTVLYDVFASDTSSLFMMLLGVIGITGEWRHRTITGALLVTPRRHVFLAAKTVAYAAAAALLSLATSIVIAIVAAAILRGRDLPNPSIGAIAELHGRNMVVAALLAAFGVCVGALLRNQVAAMISVLVLVFVIEPLVVGLRPEVGKYGPTSALAASVAGLPPETIGAEDGSLLAAFPAGIALVAWIAAIGAVAAALLVRRDLT